MVCPDIGTTIYFQPYVLFRPWHNNQLSIVCFFQTLAQQSTINRMFCPRHWYSNQLSSVYFVVQDIGTTINYLLYVLSRNGITIIYQPYVSSISWHNNQLSTVCFVQDLGTTINYQRMFRPRHWYSNQLSTIYFVHPLA